MRHFCLTCTVPIVLAGCGAMFARDEAERGRCRREPAFFAPETRAIVVEVDYVRARAPSARALATLEKRLREITLKEVVVSCDDELPPGAPGAPAASRTEVRAIERAIPGVVGLHVLYEGRDPEAGLRGFCNTSRARSSRGGSRTTSARYSARDLRGSLAAE